MLDNKSSNSHERVITVMLIPAAGDGSARLEDIAMDSTKVAEHHEKAAEHHQKAAEHHRHASQHHQQQDHEKGAHHAHLAHGHHLHATEQSEQAAKKNLRGLTGAGRGGRAEDGRAGS